MINIDQYNDVYQYNNDMYCSFAIFILKPVRFYLTIGTLLLKITINTRASLMLLLLIEFKLQLASISLKYVILEIRHLLNT